MKLQLLLAVAAADKILHGTLHDVPASASENQALLNLKKTPIRDTDATIGDAIKQNNEVSEQLNRIVAMPFFSTYKVDLSDSRCPLEADMATCANRQCAIEPLSSEDIDENLFKLQYLGRLRKNSVSKMAPEGVSGEECTPDGVSLLASSSGKDYCYPEDESKESDGVWVDLNGNTERFTGYSGPHTQLMWSKVYAENCFGYKGDGTGPSFSIGDHAVSSMLDSNANNAMGSTFDQLANVMAHPQAEPVDFELPVEECVEQRLFYRILSGMHASISTHLTYDWLNSTNDKWQTNFPEWLERVGWHEDRLNNLFFDYALISRAISKLVNSYEKLLLFSPSCHAVDIEVRVALRRLGRQLRLSPFSRAIDESAVFASPKRAALKNEFRNRVRNVNALMSCVGCERCRLWGKIQTAGYGTALKILFELPQNAEDDEDAVSELLSTFRRSELVALINTFARLSHSVHATEEFWEDAEAQLVDKKSFKYSAKQELDAAVVAVKFILWSYVEFPKNLFHIILVYLNEWYIRFTLGKQPMVADISELQDFHDL